ncbi:hypothetical protein TVAG_404340 [Trichomonas vaginalis G3]|uniref:Uncharacterized protein n=1 Tax=Trichomonas vaginalis (strain ATCC PRA-98 / G3) TaxID=412133 RepID=A2EGI3_TRIV3|nr:Ankyrin repeat family [Trichomonas vaginalis G3]EAY08266.1 hypothetical protein TVAG_404340 [Trichomonas vaginalis G3]KAI5507492.1 Ankyrin repeat family [Trichomonas vaginalis G3]|eukprot:XP_001320489.1 hypothetical protein [Trichomonas vaginalis G3]
MKRKYNPDLAFEFILDDDYDCLSEMELTSIHEFDYCNRKRHHLLQFMCAAFNAFDCFIYLTQELFDFDETDDKGKRPIHYAAEYGATEVFSYIMNIYKRKGMLKKFFEELKLKNKIESNVLYLAANSGVHDIYKILSDYGFDFSFLGEDDYQKLLSEICKSLSNNPINDQNVIIFFLNLAGNIKEGNSSRTALMMAIIQMLDAEIILKLTNHIDINLKDDIGNTAFDYACFYKNVEAAKILIEKDIEASFEQKGFWNICRLQDPNVARVAFRKYAKLMKPNFYEFVNKSFPITELTSISNEDTLIGILGLLLDYGYDPNAKEDARCPTIFECILTSYFPNKVKTLEFLLEKKIDIDHPFHVNPGDTPRSYLKKIVNPDIVKLRKKYEIN